MWNRGDAYILGIYFLRLELRTLNERLKDTSFSFYLFVNSLFI